MHADALNMSVAGSASAHDHHSVLLMDTSTLVSADQRGPAAANPGPCMACLPQEVLVHICAQLGYRDRLRRFAPVCSFWSTQACVARAEQQMAILQLIFQWYHHAHTQHCISYITSH